MEKELKNWILKQEERIKNAEGIDNSEYVLGASLNRPSYIYADDDGLIVYFGNEYTRVNYEIGWNRIQDDAAVLGWVLQLSGKTWCNGDIITEFIGRCETHLNKDYHI